MASGQRVQALISSFSAVSFIVSAAERTAFLSLPLATPPTRGVRQSHLAKPSVREEEPGCLYADTPYARPGLTWTAIWGQCSVSVCRARITFAHNFYNYSDDAAGVTAVLHVITHKQSMRGIARFARGHAGDFTCLWISALSHYLRYCSCLSHRPELPQSVFNKL